MQPSRSSPGVIRKFGACVTSRPPCSARPRVTSARSWRAAHAMSSRRTSASWTAAAALESGDVERAGRLLSASHASLRDLYEVSSPELDALVEIAEATPGVLGSRLTGAGFGGCTVTLVRREAVAALAEAVAERYPARTGLTPQVFEVEPVERGADARCLTAPPTSCSRDPHRRWDPLRGEWVLVSPGRTDRPWQGSAEPPERRCAVSVRPGLLPVPGQHPRERRAQPGLRRTRSCSRTTSRPSGRRPPTPPGARAAACCGRRGSVARAASCASRRATISISARWTPPTCAASSTSGRRRPRRSAAAGGGSRCSRTAGAAMGASNPHPHGQVWAGTALPGGAGPRGRHPAGVPRGPRPVAAHRRRRPRGRWPARRRVVGALARDRAVLGRLAVRDAGAPAGTGSPAAGPRRPTDATTWRRSWAGSLRRYDGLFDVPFPYSMGWHGAPFEADAAHRRVAAPRPRLPAAAPLGDRAQVHGRLRAAGRAAARPAPRGGRRAPSRRGDLTLGRPADSGRGRVASRVAGR